MVDLQRLPDVIIHSSCNQGDVGQISRDIISRIICNIIFFAVYVIYRTEQNIELFQIPAPNK